MARPILIADSITKLPPEAPGAVIICGSHGGVYVGYLAAKAGLAGVILSDAGVGRDRAGIGALPYLDALDVAAATVGHMSARIGDGADIAARGIITHANAMAERLGVAPGLSAQEAARRMTGAPGLSGTPPAQAESRRRLALPFDHPAVWVIDSAALVDKVGDVGAILVTGSHGGLMGGKPALALQVDGLAALYNDAGVGADGAGITRLPALDQRGIAAGTVSALSARIGDATSTYEDGVLSHVNDTARTRGVREGMSAREFVERLARG
jgi:hypothetical protein